MLTERQKKQVKKIRSKRYILNLFNKLIDAIEERKEYFVERRGDYYCKESDALRNIREDIRDAQKAFIIHSSEIVKKAESLKGW
jgi:hypothetical protein